MAEPKTRATKASVNAFLAKVTDPDRRADCHTLVKLMRQATRAEPTMWGTSIVGFGTYPCTYADGKVRDWPVIGFSPRKRDLTLYIMAGTRDYAADLKRLGKHKATGSCLYLNRLADVDLTVLKGMMQDTVREMKRRHPG